MWKYEKNIGKFVVAELIGSRTHIENAAQEGAAEFVLGTRNGKEFHSILCPLRRMPRKKYMSANCIVIILQIGSERKFVTRGLRPEKPNSPEEKPVAYNLFRKIIITNKIFVGNFITIEKECVK